MALVPRGCGGAAAVLGEARRGAAGLGEQLCPLAAEEGGDPLADQAAAVELLLLVCSHGLISHKTTYNTVVSKLQSKCN